MKPRKHKINFQRFEGYNCNRQHNHQQRTDMTNGVVSGCCAPDANSNSELGEQNEHPERARWTTPQDPHHLTRQPLTMERVTVSESSKSECDSHSAIRQKNRVIPHNRRKSCQFHSLHTLRPSAVYRSGLKFAIYIISHSPLIRKCVVSVGQNLKQSKYFSLS